MAPSTHPADVARDPGREPERFDVSVNLAAIVGMVRTLIGSRLEITADAPPGLFMVEADPLEFDTCIVNILLNARDAIDGDGRLDLTVDARDGVPASRGRPEAPGAFVAITLSDTGCGIAEDQIDAIFEPFFTTKADGLGLGLSQVVGFLKDVGGEIRVESEVGEGSTFTLYLPLAAEPAPSDHAVPAPFDGRGLSVLIVEDNEEIGSLTVEALTGLGYSTVLAHDGATALDRIDEEPTRFDVVFSDVVMPRMSGVHLGLEIRRRHRDLPVVLTSGYSQVLTPDGTYGFEFLEKPYSIDDLSAILRKTTAWRRRRRKWAD
jgi:CheY-like chemotaxis protein